MNEETATPRWPINGRNELHFRLMAFSGEKFFSVAALTLFVSFRTARLFFLVSFVLRTPKKNKKDFRRSCTWNLMLRLHQLSQWPQSIASVDSHKGNRLWWRARTFSRPPFHPVENEKKTLGTRKKRKKNTRKTRYDALR